MPPKKTSEPKSALPAVYQDAQRRTCIKIRVTGTTVLHIPLVVATPLRLVPARAAAFDVLWKPVKDYPIEKAAQLFVRYTQDLGGDKGCMEALASIIKVSHAQRERAASVINKVQKPAPPTKAKGAY